MNKRLLLPMLPMLLLWMLAGPTGKLNAQSLSANFEIAKFRYSDTLTMFEYYLRVHSGSVNFVTQPNKKIQAVVNCKVTVLKDEKVVMTDVFNLASPEVDSLVTFLHFNTQRRMFLTPDNYTLQVALKDVNLEHEPRTYSTELNLTFPEDKISISDLQLLDSYSKTDKQGSYVKNGFFLESHNSMFFPEEEKYLKYYFELYNSPLTVTKDEEFLIFIGIEDAQTYHRMQGMAKTIKQSSRKEIAQIGKLNITSLPSGNYNFFVEVKNNKNQVLLVKKKLFQRSNPKMEPEALPAEKDISKTFAHKYDLNTVKFYVSAFRPIADDAERNNIVLVEKTEDTLMAQSFLYNFWHVRHPENPEFFWEQYKKWIDHADEKLSPKSKRGYMTDMGRVYLTYGPPNRVEDERNDPLRDVQGTTTPYQIWYYNDIPNSNQTNRLFVFVNKSKAGYSYEMIHSTVRGENYIDDWLGHMKWKDLLHNYTGNERIDYSRDDNRFNNGGGGTGWE